MDYRLVKYRATDYRYNQYAVIPITYLSDLVDWLTLSESAEIVSVTDNIRGVPEFLATQEWPSYRTCANHVLLSDMLTHAR